MAKREQLPAEVAAAVTDILMRPKYEVIPLKNVYEQAQYLPPDVTVTVTASPAKGLDATVSLAMEFAEKGYDVIPHLSARMVKDKEDLARILGLLDQAGITKAFVVGGDADDPGEFFDGLSLLEAMESIGHGLTEIGIPSYPEGHAVIPDDALLQALKDKQRYAGYMATQMCFDPDVIVSWIRAMRAEGITLPVHIGLPGVAPLHKLITISTRIGIGASMRFLSKNTSLVGKLVKPGGYSPDVLIERLGPALLDDEIDIEAFHVYTFNQVDTTEEWRRAFVRGLS